MSKTTCVYGPGKDQGFLTLSPETLPGPSLPFRPGEHNQLPLCTGRLDQGSAEWMSGKQMYKQGDRRTVVGGWAVAGTQMDGVGCMNG